MNTIVTDTTAEDLQAIKAGRNFFLLQTKVLPQVGQPLILQAGDEGEFSTKIELVHNSPGMMKNWYILAWDVKVLEIGNGAGNGMALQVDLLGPDKIKQ